jgi:hypothetical protein
MDLNEKMNNHNNIVEGINKHINKLINEEEDDSTSSEPLPNDSGEISSATDKLIGLGKQLFRDKSKIEDVDNTDQKGIKVTLKHDPIEFKEDFDGKVIPKMSSAGYSVYSVTPSSSGVLLKLSAKNNKHLKKIGNNLELWIEIPNSEGLNYKSDFNPTLIQVNTDTKDKEELDSVTMRVVKHNYKKTK